MNEEKKTGDSKSSRGRRIIDNDEIIANQSDEQTASEEVPPQRLKRRRRSSGYKSPRTVSHLRLIVLIAAIVAAAIACSVIYYNKMLEPVSSSTEEVIVQIPEGSTVKDVAETLYDQGLIKSELVFQSYAGRHSRGEQKIQAGTYAFSPSMSSVDIFNALLEGSSYEGATQVVIPEGKNIKEIAQILEDNNICSADDFIAETENLSKYKKQYSILSSIPDDAEGRTPLEGYLYPDTYHFAPQTSASTVVSTMIARFQEEYSDDMLKETKKQNKTVDEIVTMASIVELEAKYAEDKPKVASVFYNRINNNMKLQSDITVVYALDGKTDLTSDDLKTDSPYNTYTNDGLPIGPICSPGMDSLKAALYPASTNYLYFIADESTGKIYYNETYEGHQADIQKYLNQ